MNMIDGQSVEVDYDDWLAFSINHFITKYHKNDSDLSRYQHLYQQKFQGKKDLPIEIDWFCTAVSFHCSKPNSLPPPEKLLVAKNLLHSLKTISSSYSGVKKMAIIAPVFYMLYHLDLQFSSNDWCLMEEIRSDIEELTCYFSICCSQCLDGGEEGLSSLRKSFVDVLRVWTLDQIQGIYTHANIMRTFFPILNNMFQDEITTCLGYLAGAVMTETLMWRMCLRIPQVTKEQLPGNMLILAVQTIKGFQNFYFIDMLFKMLLEPHLPVVSLMCSQDAIILHKVLYDAVVSIDYSFYYERWSQSSEGHFKKLAPLWLLVADRAIMFAWSKNDIVLVHSYLDAFHKCQIVAEIIDCVNIQTGMDVPDIGSITVTPRVFIEWLLIQEDHGIKIFDGALLPYARATISMTPMERNSFFETPINDNIQLGSSSSHNILWPVKGETDGKKRKEIFPEVQESQLKHVKYGDEGPTWNFFPCSSDDESCDGTEVIYVNSDDDEIDDEEIDEEESDDEETEGEY